MLNICACSVYTAYIYKEVLCIYAILYRYSYTEEFVAKILMKQRQRLRLYIFQYILIYTDICRSNIDLEAVAACSMALRFLRTLARASRGGHSHAAFRFALFFN